MPGNFSCSELWSEQQPTGLCRAWPAPSLLAGATAGEPTWGACGHVHGKHGASPCCHPGHTVRAEPPISQQYLRVWGSRTSCDTQELAKEQRAMPPSLGVASCGDGTGTSGLGIAAACPAGTWDSSASPCAGAGEQEGARGSPPERGGLRVAVPAVGLQGQLWPAWSVRTCCPLLALGLQNAARSPSSPSALALRAAPHPGELLWHHSRCLCWFIPKPCPAHRILSTIVVLGPSLRATADPEDSSTTPRSLLLAPMGCWLRVLPAVPCHGAGSPCPDTLGTSLGSLSPPLTKPTESFAFSPGCIIGLFPHNCTFSGVGALTKSARPRWFNPNIHLDSL